MSERCCNTVLDLVHCTMRFVVKTKVPPKRVLKYWSISYFTVACVRPASCACILIDAPVTTTPLLGLLWRLRTCIGHGIILDIAHVCLSLHPRWHYRWNRIAHFLSMCPPSIFSSTWHASLARWHSQQAACCIGSCIFEEV